MRRGLGLCCLGLRGEGVVREGVGLGLGFILGLDLERVGEGIGEGEGEGVLVKKAVI